MPRMPKRVKFRKQMRGKMKGNATRGNYVAFGEFGLQSLENTLDLCETNRSGSYCSTALFKTTRQSCHSDLPR